MGGLCEALPKDWAYPRFLVLRSDAEGNKGYGTGTEAEPSRELECGQESRLSHRVPRLESALPVCGSEVSLDYEPVHMFIYEHRMARLERAVACQAPGRRVSPFRACLLVLR